MLAQFLSKANWDSLTAYYYVHSSRDDASSYTFYTMEKNRSQPNQVFLCEQWHFLNLSQLWEVLELQ